MTAATGDSTELQPLCAAAQPSPATLLPDRSQPATEDIGGVEMIHQHHRIASAVALAFALAASIAPAASADPQPLARAEATIAAGGQAPTAARPNPDEQTLTQATANSGPCSEACSGSGYDLAGTSSVESGARLPHNPLAGTGLLSQQPSRLVAATRTPAVVHVTAPSGGFDWGDAGVGAGGMLALILIAAGGVLTMARRRTHSVAPTPRPNPQAQH
jgi:hypothetical protein